MHDYLGLGDGVTSWSESTVALLSLESGRQVEWPPACRAIGAARPLCDPTTVKKDTPINLAIAPPDSNAHRREARAARPEMRAIAPDRESGPCLRPPKFVGRAHLHTIHNPHTFPTPTPQEPTHTRNGILVVSLSICISVRGSPPCASLSQILSPSDAPTHTLRDSRPTHPKALRSDHGLELRIQNGQHRTHIRRAANGTTLLRERHELPCHPKRGPLASQLGSARLVQ